MSIPLISYISCIYSRLSYLNPREFNASYSEIFSNKLILEQIKQIPTVSLTNLFHIDTKQIENCNEMVNKIIYLKKKEYVKNDNFMFFSISTSNYAGVFITADKTMNTITVSFRGTYSVKSALSYSKLSSLTPTVICNKKGGVLIGIYKIIHEIFNTILECMNFLKKENLKKNPTVITTGHSLGGACATIFSYLYYLNTKKPIICITFGSPRVFNYELIQKYNSFIKKNKILFHRYITNGDPFGKLPPNIPKSTDKTFFHPDDNNSKLENISYLCDNQTRKTICTFKSKTKKRKPDLKYHGNYLGISYKDAADNLKNMKKEIKRNKSGDTICRLVKGNKEQIEAVFFNLQELKHKAFNSKSKTKKLREKIGKIFKTDYKRGDAYMNKNQFDHLLKNMEVIQDNKLKTDTYIELLSDQPENKTKIC